MTKLYKKLNPYLVITLVTLVSTLILWSPFILRFRSVNGIKIDDIGFQTITRHWDGPLYIIPAKTLYDRNNPALGLSPMGYDPKYFAAHLPLYPLTIRLFAGFLSYPQAMVFSTLFFSVILLNFFYFFLKRLKLTEMPLALTMVLAFLTPRFFVVRSIGSPESLFMFLVLSSIYFFITKKYWLAGLLGGLATATKTPGLLLFFGYSLFFIEEWFKTKKMKAGWLNIFLIPTGLLAVFGLYWKQYGDFFAYFHSGDNIHLVFPPFSVFNFQKNWVGTGWLEDIIFVYFFYFLAILTIFEKKELRPVFYFMTAFFFSIIFVQHRDISRYSLPLLPFGLITFEKFFRSKKFLIILLLLLPAIYLYGWDFIVYNTAPIADWTPFL